MKSWSRSSLPNPHTTHAYYNPHSSRSEVSRIAPYLRYATKAGNLPSKCPAFLKWWSHRGEVQRGGQFSGRLLQPMSVLHFIVSWRCLLRISNTQILGLGNIGRFEFIPLSHRLQSRSRATHHIRNFRIYVASETLVFPAFLKVHSDNFEH